LIPLLYHAELSLERVGFSPFKFSLLFVTFSFLVFGCITDFFSFSFFFVMRIVSNIRSIYFACYKFEDGNFKASYRSAVVLPMACYYGKHAFFHPRVSRCRVWKVLYGMLIFEIAKRLYLMDITFEIIDFLLLFKKRRHVACYNPRLNRKKKRKSRGSYVYVKYLGLILKLVSKGF